MFSSEAISCYLGEEARLDRGLCPARLSNSLKLAEVQQSEYYPCQAAAATLCFTTPALWQHEPSPATRLARQRPPRVCTCPEPSLQVRDSFPPRRRLLGELQVVWGHLGASLLARPSSPSASTAPSELHANRQIKTGLIETLEGGRREVNK